MSVKSKKKSEDEWILLIANGLKYLRKEKGFGSYETFALDHGLYRKQYWRAESGSNLTFRSLIKILEIHNLSIVDFFSNLLDQ
jgi:hypothetical protein